MNADSHPSGVNRLTRHPPGGDEPLILGIVTATTRAVEADAPEAVGREPVDALLAPLPVRNALAEILDDWDERARRGEPPHTRRLKTNHVSRDTGGLYDLNEFERALAGELDHLVWMCLRPLQDLRYDEVIQPVGRVRRPARGAAQQLSAHSEQWERWAPDFPIPREVLASIREDDTDLYENRVAKTLVVGALVHLHRRLQQLRSQLTKNTQGRLVLLSGWHWRQERLRASFDEQDVDFTIEMLELTVNQLQEMAARLSALGNSPLFVETGGRARVQSLRITNILRRDPRYRRIPPLWKLWSSAQDEVLESMKRLDNPALSQRGMDVLTEVLSSKAISWLGFELDVSTGVYRNGHSSIVVDSLDGATELTINDSAGTRTVRLVALATPLLAAEEPEPLRNAHVLDDWLTAHAAELGSVGILHPADAGDLATVDRQERDLIDHTGFDAVDVCRTWALIPATPLLIDSLERVTRFLRWHLTAPTLTAAPTRIFVGNVDRNDRKALDSLKFAHLDGDHLVISGPLSDPEWKHLFDMAVRRPSGWTYDLQLARDHYGAIMKCPIYPSHGTAQTTFEPRDNGTFVCTCSGCRAKWGIDKCGACGSLIPFARPGIAVPDGQLPSDFFGGDLLSSLCEGASAEDVAPVRGGPDLRVVICPNCRRCSRSSRFRDCARCAGHAGSTS